MKKCSDNPFNYKQEGYIGEQILKKKKENSVYVWKILIWIRDNDGSTANVRSEYLSQIMSGKMLNTTCPQDNDTAAKLKGLVLALDDPANRERFVCSYFGSAVGIFRNGSMDMNSDETWVNYKPILDSAKVSYALNSAMKFYMNDSTLPVGLDMDKFLNTIVKRQGSSYVLTNVSAREGELLLEAVAENIEMMKGSAEFKRNYAKI